MKTLRLPLVLPMILFLFSMHTATAQPKFDPPKTYPPDELSLKQIEVKAKILQEAIEKLPSNTPDDVFCDVAIYAKASEWIVRHGDFFHKDSAKHTLIVLDAGIARAQLAAKGETPWRKLLGKPIVRGYRSSVDGSIQPYSVILPEGFGTREQQWRLDVVLQGRDQSKTEVKFLYARESAKTANRLNDYIVLEPYGRGNNAYRWAGETDVFESLQSFVNAEKRTLGKTPVDSKQLVLRGFSMGGAGTWQIGLHHPFRFAVLGPGAGFTTTRGYIKNLPAQLPDHQEACLHIYDAVDYSWNAFNVPIVAYSGEKDPQKAAADLIEQRVKKLNGPFRFTHLIAPGLEHQLPAEWQAKAEAEYRKHLTNPQPRDHVRFETYTTRFNDFGWGQIEELDQHYKLAQIEGTWKTDKLELNTLNIRVFSIRKPPQKQLRMLIVNGQELDLTSAPKEEAQILLEKKENAWKFTTRKLLDQRLRKHHANQQPLQGPIDDAFMDRFDVVLPTAKGWFESVTSHAQAEATRFQKEWDRYFRGRIPFYSEERSQLPQGNLILFGDPGSNPMIAEVLKGLPITWTQEKLVVNGVTYDPKNHLPVLIYPNPKNPGKYVVLNSGHTFREADLKGTNALLYPRLGDWAVIKLTENATTPTQGEVVTAGLFDESWQFPSK